MKIDESGKWSDQASIGGVRQKVQGARPFGSFGFVTSRPLAP
jgi:hypothetical protein